MTVTYRGGVAVIQLIAFAPSLAIAFILVFRHGLFGKNAGWHHVISLSFLRIVGAICELIAIRNPSDGVVITAIICSFIGLAPLILLCLALLGRVYVSRSCLKVL